MTAHKSSPETILLGREMGGDKGKDLRRDAVRANGGVPPLADGQQRGRCFQAESTNLIEGEVANKVSASPSRLTIIYTSQRTTENTLRASAPRSERRRAAKGPVLFQGKPVCPWRG